MDTKIHLTYTGESTEVDIQGSRLDILTMLIDVAERSTTFKNLLTEAVKTLESPDFQEKKNKF